MTNHQAQALIDIAHAFDDLVKLLCFLSGDRTQALLYCATIHQDMQDGINSYFLDHSLGHLSEGKSPPRRVARRKQKRQTRSKRHG